MAARKKVKKVRKETSSFAPKVQHDIPEGFVMPAGAQVPNWNFEKQKILKGTVVNIKMVKTPKNKNRKITRLMVIREDGTEKLLQFWESAALVGLFDEAKPGFAVYLSYEGLAEKKKGQNPMKLFHTAYKKKN